MRLQAMLVGVGLASAALLASPALATCPHTVVKDVGSSCISKRCPKGLQAYWAVIRNDFPHKLYITYAFRSGPRDTAIIPGGLELQPNSADLQPIGIGHGALPLDEDLIARNGRLRILECGTDPNIRYKWRLG